MIYEIIESDLGQFVNMTLDDGTVKSIKVNDANPEYVAFLESINDDSEAE
jgi:hypothetical protein